MEPFDPLLLENQLCFPLYAASREVIKRYHPHLTALGLTYTQYITLMVLWAEGQISAKALGQRLYLDSGTLTPVLKSLENKGYLRRFRCPEDERVLMAALTEAGRALKKEAAAIPEKISGCVKLDAEEAIELYQLLYKLLTALQE